MSRKALASVLAIMLLVPLAGAAEIPPATPVERAAPYVLRAALSLGIGAAAIATGAGLPLGAAVAITTFVAPEALNLLFGYINSDAAFKGKSAEETYAVLESLDFENLELGNDPKTLMNGETDDKTEAILGDVSGLWKTLAELKGAKESCKTRYTADYEKWQEGSFNQSSVFGGFRSCLLADFAPKLEQFNRNYAQLLDRLSELLKDDYEKFTEVDGITLEEYHGPLVSCVLPVTELYLTYEDFRANKLLCPAYGDSMAQRLARAVCALQGSKKLSDHFNIVAGTDSVAFEVLNHHLECLKLESEERHRYQQMIEDYPARIGALEERYRKIFDAGFCGIMESDTAILGSVESTAITAPTGTGATNPKATCEQLKAGIGKIKDEERNIRLSYKTFGRRITATEGVVQLFDSLESKATELETQTAGLVANSRTEADGAISRLLSLRKGFAVLGAEGAALVSFFTKRVDAANAAFEEGDAAAVPGQKAKAYLRAIGEANDGYEALRPATTEEQQELRREAEEALRLATADLDCIREKTVLEAAKATEKESPEVARAKYAAVLQGSEFFGVSGVYPQAKATYSYLTEQRQHILGMTELMPEKFKAEIAEIGKYDSYFPGGVLDASLALGSLRKMSDAFTAVEKKIEAEIAAEPAAVLVSQIERAVPGVPKTVIANSPTPVTLSLELKNPLAVPLEVPQAKAKLAITPSYHLSASNVLSTTIPVKIGYDDGLLVHTDPIPANGQLLAKLHYEGDVASSKPAACTAVEITDALALWDCRIEYELGYAGDYELLLPAENAMLEYAAGLEDYKDEFAAEGGTTYVRTMPVKGPWERRIRIQSPVKVTTNISTSAGDGVIIDERVLVTNLLPLAYTVSLKLPVPYSDVSEVSLPNYKLSGGKLSVPLQLLPREAKQLSFSYKVKDANVLAEELLAETASAILAGGTAFSERRNASKQLFAAGKYSEAVGALMQLKTDIANRRALESAGAEELKRLDALKAQAAAYVLRLGAAADILRSTSAKMPDVVGATNLLEQANARFDAGDLAGAERIYTDVMKAKFSRADVEKRLEIMETNMSKALAELDGARFALLSLGFEAEPAELEGLNADYRGFVDAQKTEDVAGALTAYQNFEAGLEAARLALAGRASEAFAGLRIKANRTQAELGELRAGLKEKDMKALSVGLTDRFAKWAEENGYAAPDLLQKKRAFLLERISAETSRLGNVSRQEPLAALAAYKDADQTLSSEAADWLKQVDGLVSAKQRDAEMQMEEIKAGIAGGTLLPNAELILTEAERTYATGRYLDALIYTEYIRKEMSVPKASRLTLFAGVALLLTLFGGLYYSRKIPARHALEGLEARIRRRREPEA